jgi:ribose 5-phosphate isomerase A
MDLKQHAAAHAVQQVSSGMKLGLGSGTTVQYVLHALAERLNDGSLRDIVGVPTSEETARQAAHLGIPLATLEECPRLDLTIDGADEVDPDLNLIKGLGGALFREKIVALASERVLIVVDASKDTDCLGKRAPLPVEVLPFGWNLHLSLLESLGSAPELRKQADDSPYCTDNGNYIIHCAFLDGILDPYALAEALDTQTGIVEHGLFLGIASEVVIATPEGVKVRSR